LAEEKTELRGSPRAQEIGNFQKEEQKVRLKIRRQAFRLNRSSKESKGFSSAFLYLSIIFMGRFLWDMV
jgi:hypothetical protein